jgi:hypothetical protein
MSTHSIGYVDEGVIGGYGDLVDALLEYVPDLIWPLSVRTYSRMRWDPVLASVLKAYTLPIRRAPWAFDGTGCRPEVVAFVAAQLGLRVKGADDDPGPARRSGVDWSEHLRLSLLDLTFGHMPFERTYDVSDGATARLVLQERMPQSIAAIRSNPDGSLKSITQNLGVTAAGAPEIAGRTWSGTRRPGKGRTGRGSRCSAPPTPRGC